MNHVHEVQFIPKQQVPALWGALEHYFAKACKHIDDFNLPDVRENLESGKWSLFVARKDGVMIGACTVSFLSSSNKALIANVDIAGGKFIYVHEVFQLFINYLHDELGVTTLRAYGRASISRLLQKLGMQEKSTLLELNLENKE